MCRFNLSGAIVKLKKLLTATVLASAAAAAQAGTVLTENFDNVAGLTGAGWAQVSSGTGPGSGWFQGNSGVFPAADGAANSYAAANFVDVGGSIADWLMTPVLSLADGMSMQFMLRLLGDGFLDRVDVFVSTSGASTSTGDFTSLASFSSSADTGWASQTVAISGIGSITTGRLAFRYFVADTAVDGNYAGIDSLSVVPEPASLALVSLALAGAFAARRRA
jgi:hypothetical protein